MLSSFSKNVSNKCSWKPYLWSSDVLYTGTLNLKVCFRNLSATLKNTVMRLLHAILLQFKYILQCGECSYLLLFQVWTTSGSEIPCWRAWSSKKSNMYLMARGNALPRWAVLKMVSNKSSTNFWRVPYNEDITQKLSKVGSMKYKNIFKFFTYLCLSLDTQSLGCDPNLGPPK